MDGSMYGPGNGGYPPMMNMSVGDGMDGGTGWLRNHRKSIL